MSKNITDQQVERLFQFCHDHYAPFYDLLIGLGIRLYIELFILPVKGKGKFMTEYGKFALS